MGKKKTHEEFLEELKEKQNEIYNSLEFITEYSKAKEYIFVRDNYGVCKVKPDNLLNGKTPNINSAINKREYLIEMIKIYNPEFINSINSIGEYKGMLENLYINTEYGQCRMKPTSILSGSLPSLKSATNKVDCIKNILKHKLPDNYKKILDYGSYNGYHKHMNIKTKYGWCGIKPSNLLNGKFPSIESALDKNTYYINMAIEVHGFKYDYSKLIYNFKDGKVCIVCPEHGEFWQKADNHLYGYGCRECGIKMLNGGYNKTQANRNMYEWKNIKAIVYTIKCDFEDEVFYKVGITTKTIEERFVHNMPYNYMVIDKIHTNLYDAIYIEKEIHNKNKQNSYSPSIYFGGWTECFHKIE